MRSTLQHTLSPPQSNEATSHEDELSKIYGRHQQVTRLPRSDTKLENMMVGTPPKIREIPAKMMSIEEAKAIKIEHDHPKPLPLQSTSLRTAQMTRPTMSGIATEVGTLIGAFEGSSGLSEEDKASIEAATNKFVEGKYITEQSSGAAPGMC